MRATQARIDQVGDPEINANAGKASSDGELRGATGRIDKCLFFKSA